jgi:hypothetical protein
MRTVQRSRLAGMMPAAIERLMVSTDTRSNAAVSARVQSSSIISFVLGLLPDGVLRGFSDRAALGARVGGGYLPIDSSNALVADNIASFLKSAISSSSEMEREAIAKTLRSCASLALQSNASVSCGRCFCFFDIFPHWRGLGIYPRDAFVSEKVFVCQGKFARR